MKRVKIILVIVYFIATAVILIGAVRGWAKPWRLVAPMIAGRWLAIDATGGSFVFCYSSDGLAPILRSDRGLIAADLMMLESVRSKRSERDDYPLDLLQMIDSLEAKVLGQIIRTRTLLTMKYVQSSGRLSTLGFYAEVGSGSPDYVVLRAPVFAVLGVFGIPLVMAFVWHKIWGHRIRRNLCRECGYVLYGNISGICPECGTPIPEEQIRATERLAKADSATASP